MNFVANETNLTGDGPRIRMGGRQGNPELRSHRPICAPESNVFERVFRWRAETDEAQTFHTPGPRQLTALPNGSQIRQ